MTKPLRVAMVISTDQSAAGGVQNHVLFLTKELEKRGHTCVVFGPKTKKLHFGYSQYVEYCNRVPVTIPNNNVADFTLPSRLTEAAIARINEEFDICHVHSPYVPLVNWQVISQVSIPIVTTFHMAWEEDSHLTMAENIIPLFKQSFSDNVSGAIFVSGFSQKRWSSLCSPEMIKEVVLNCYDPLCVVKESKKKTVKKTKLLFLGRLVKNKGLHYLLKALAITPGLKEKVHLDVVGEGADKSSFQKLAKKYELQNCVTFHGEIRGQDRIAYYQKSDIFCVPYQDEGLSLTLLEAMACGCSLVGFENQSFAEVLKGYPESRCFVPQKKVEKLGEALFFAIQNPKKMAAVSMWNAKRAKKYSVQRMTNETLNVYSKVLD